MMYKAILKSLLKKAVFRIRTRRKRNAIEITGKVVENGGEPISTDVHNGVLEYGLRAGNSFGVLALLRIMSFPCAVGAQSQQDGVGHGGAFTL